MAGSGRTGDEGKITNKVECICVYDDKTDSYIFYTNYPERGMLVTKVSHEYYLICENCNRLDVYNGPPKKYCSYCTFRGQVGRLHDRAILNIDSRSRCTMCGRHFVPNKLDIHHKNKDGEKEKKEKYNDDDSLLYQAIVERKRETKDLCTLCEKCHNLLGSAANSCGPNLSGSAGGDLALCTDFEGSISIGIKKAHARLLTKI